MCFSIAGKVPTTELYAGFKDALGPRCVSIGFGKLLSLGFWSYYRFAKRSSSTCRMTRGQEETSTSQVGQRRGSNRESPIASILVASMSVEELRPFCRVPNNISLEFSDGPTFSIVEQADNTIFFTWEQFAAGLCFPISLLVKSFLHVTMAPLALIHPNVFWILMGCSVHNFLYQLDISLVEIC